MQTSTILIVDDEPAGRDTLEGLLISEGYQLIFAADGPEALAKAEAFTPDVILLDVMMPDMDGFEVCRRLRANPLLAEIPIIILTALDDQDSRLIGIKAGADDFISKPYNRVELRARIRTITRLNRYRRLQMERSRFKWVVEQASNGYLIVNHQDEILYANGQARAYLGLSPDTSQPIQGKFLDIARQHYLARPEEAWESWPNEAQTSYDPRYLVQAETHTANAFWLQVGISEIPLASDTGQIVSLHDVTAQVALHREVQGFHELISHKLRTPLSGVLASIELIAEDIINIDSNDLVKLSRIAQASARRLHRALEDILQYVDTPALPYPGMGFNLSQLEGVVAGLGNDLALKHISIDVPKALESSQVALAERSIELILREILENSKKFHPAENPTVDITVSPAGDDKILLSICDDGITLSTEQLARVWTPYYQGDKYFTGEVKGMGLGLSLVASLVWNVGGTCHIRNRAERMGVVIELTLPLVQF